jgi:hypothetical protein
MRKDPFGAAARLAATLCQKGQAAGKTGTGDVQRRSDAKCILTY